MPDWFAQNAPAQSTSASPPPPAPSAGLRVLAPTEDWFGQNAPDQAQPVQPAAAPAVQQPPPPPATPQPVAPQGTLTPPAQVFAQADTVAKGLAAALAAPPPLSRSMTRAQMTAAAPPVPPAPVPYELQTDEQRLADPNAPTFTNPRTGRVYVRQEPGKEHNPLSEVVDSPLTGTRRLVGGVEETAQPGLRAKARGAHDIITGGFEAATPAMVVAGAAAPVSTAASLGAGMISHEAVSRGLAKLGMPEEYADVAGDLAEIIGGVAGGVGGHKLAPRAAAAIKAKYEPILRARFEKANGSVQPPVAGQTADTGWFADNAPRKQPAQAPTQLSTAPVPQPAAHADYPLIRRTDARDGKSATGLGVGPGFGVHRVPIDAIEGNEDISGDREKQADVARYETMFRAGKEPPALVGHVDEDTGRVNITDGHRRLEAAKRAGETHLPVAFLDDIERPKQSTIEQPGGANRGEQRSAAVDAGPARPLDAGRAGEGAEVHGAPASGARPHAGGRSGEATDVVIPGEDRSIPARYELRELSEIQASHNGQTFSANPKYQGRNERDYSKPENQQRVIEQSSEERFNPRYHITDNPDMTNGPPLIDEAGNALGGNSRMMSLQRVYGRDAARAAEYRALLEKKAPQFGIDPEAVRQMRQPVLVRVADPEGLAALPGGSKWAVRKTNVSGTAALSASERAAADAGQMSPEMVEHIAGAIEDAGPDATLNDALTGSSGTRIVNRLIADGFFSEQERPALMDGKTGALTQAAKDRISKALLGRFFRDSDQIARTPASMRNKIERIAAPLAKVAGNPEWDIAPDVREAIDLIEYAGAHGIRNLGDVVGQASMFGEGPKWPDGVVRLAELLRDGKPNDAVGAFRRYVNSKDAGTMFGESTPADAFRDVFGAEKPERPAEAAAQPEVGPHGPVLRQFRHDAQGALRYLLEHGTGDAVAALYHPEVGDIDLVADVAKKLRDKHPEVTGDLQGFLSGLKKVSDDGRTIQLRNAGNNQRAAVRLDFNGVAKRWLITAFDTDARTPSGRTPDVPGKVVAGQEGTVAPPGAGPESSVAPEPEPREPHGPVTLGMGLGAFEPFLRESYEDMKALKEKRDAALKELKRAEVTPGERRWGEQVRHFFTGERDLWAARANQGIRKARKLLGGEKNKRGVNTKAVVASIAREFKKRPGELKAFIAGYHPALLDITDMFQKKRVEQRLEAIRPEMEQALRQVLSGTPDAAGRAVDGFYTNMAAMTAAEGKKVGVLDTQWDPETYVPHVLHPKGEGEYPGLRKAVVRTLGGQIGKYFGFSQHRSYPTLLHAIADDVIPKTMDIHDAFTVQQDNFARSRATRLLEQQLIDTKIGQYTVQKKAPEGWEPLAPQSNEFRELVPYDTGTIDDEGQPILDTAEKRLYVKKFVADALRPITAPEVTGEIMGIRSVRVSQAATKAAQLGLSFFHATTENYMALANMGPTGWVKALRASRDSAEFLAAERDLIAHGGTTSITGDTVEAYKALQPGSIPTYLDIWRQNAAVKAMDRVANAITDFTFANLQRRFKVTDYQLHLAGWMDGNPNATTAELRIAKQGMAKEVNAIYGGLHWENIGLNKMTVEIARAVMLAPDWTISNLFNVKYALEKGPGGRMARMFWIRTLAGGLIATQAASLMFSGQFSKRPTMVFLGHDDSGLEIYQNMFFKGAPGDVTNLVTNVYDYGLEGIARTLAGKEAPLLRTFAMLQGGRDYLGHEIAPKGMNPVAGNARTVWAIGKSLSPIPFSFSNQIDMMFGPEAHKYTVPERLTTMFAGNPPQHVAPEGTHLSGGVLRPNAQREKNSAFDQAVTGQVYQRRGR